MSLLAQDERLTRKVGAITLVLLAASIAFVVFVLDRLELGSPVRIRVYFAHTTGLKPHAALVVAGQQVGRIETIEPVAKGATPLLAGEPGSAAIIAVDGDQAWKVPRAAEIFVSSRGPFSQRYLEVAPPPGEPGPSITEGAELRGADPPALDSTLYRAWAQMQVARSFAEQVRPEWEAFTTELDKLRAQLDGLGAEVDVGTALADVRAVGTEVDQLRHTLVDTRVTARFSATLATARSTLARAQAAIDRLSPQLAALALEARRVRGHLEAHDPIARGEAVLARIREAIAKVDPLLAKIEEINQRIARGEGSLGRIMTDPEFPEDTKELGKILKRQPWKVMTKPTN